MGLKKQKLTSKLTLSISKSPNVYPVLATLTILACGPAATILGSSIFVRRKWPIWFYPQNHQSVSLPHLKPRKGKERLTVPNCNSMPSLVSLYGNTHITPAQFTNPLTTSAFPLPNISFAPLRTLS